MSVFNTLLTLGAVAVGGYVFVTYILPQLGNLQLPTAAAAPAPAPYVEPTPTYVEPTPTTVYNNNDDDDKSDRDLLEELLGEDISRREANRFLDYLDRAEDEEDYEDYVKDLPVLTKGKSDDIGDWLTSKEGLKKLTNNAKAQIFGKSDDDDDDDKDKNDIDKTIDELKKVVGETKPSTGLTDAQKKAAGRCGVNEITGKYVCI